MEKMYVENRARSGQEERDDRKWLDTRLFSPHIDQTTKGTAREPEE